MIKKIVLFTTLALCQSLVVAMQPTAEEQREAVRQEINAELKMVNDQIKQFIANLKAVKASDEPFFTQFLQKISERIAALKVIMADGELTGRAEHLRTALQLATMSFNLLEINKDRILGNNTTPFQTIAAQQPINPSLMSGIKDISGLIGALEYGYNELYGSGGSSNLNQFYQAIHMKVSPEKEQALTKEYQAIGAIWSKKANYQNPVTIPQNNGQPLSQPVIAPPTPEIKKNTQVSPAILPTNLQQPENSGNVVQTAHQTPSAPITNNPPAKKGGLANHPAFLPVTLVSFAIAIPAIIAAAIAIDRKMRNKKNAMPAVEAA